MSLRKWAENGWLRQQETNSNEIKMLLGVVDRDLADTAVDKISPDLRFIAALGAGMLAATIALRACGYRATVGRGQHEKTIESLELTIGASSKTVQMLKTFSRKRNTANYDMSGAVSEQELQQMQKLAAELRGQVESLAGKEPSQSIEMMPPLTPVSPQVVSFTKPCAERWVSGPSSFL